MVDIRIHSTQKGEVSIMEVKESNITKFKFTRRLPKMAMAETKMFPSKELALQQVEKWLS